MDINALNNLSYGMYVITTTYNDRKIGCFVNTVTQITAQNPIISISISKNNYTNEAMKINKKIGISILSEKTDPKVIGRFGFFSSRDVDKFDDIEYIEINDIPIVNENICGYLICEVLNIIDGLLDTSKIEKNLWTENEDGNKITYYKAFDERDESFYVIKEIKKVPSGTFFIL